MSKNNKRSRTARRSMTPKAPMASQVAGASGVPTAAAPGGGVPKPQVGGAPGSIASSPLIPSITLKSFTDLFSGKTNFFTLQSPAKNIMNSSVLTAAHNFFHNLNTSTFFAGFVMLILNIG